MKISTETVSLKTFYATNEERLAALKAAGFDAYDFSMFESNKEARLIDGDGYKKEAQKLRSFADGIDLCCNQSHAPFPSVIPGDEAYNRKTFLEIVRSLEVTAILGGKLCVVHPCNDYSPEQNAEFYKTLEPYARNLGVKIALENMYNWSWDSTGGHAIPAACSDEENFCKHMALLDHDVFCALLDIGHAEMAGLNTSAEKMIKRLGKSLSGIHLHDNDRVHDSHTLPFLRAIDYSGFISALKEINYAGDITLEASEYLPKYPKELASSAIRMMAETANYFRTKITG